MRLSTGIVVAMAAGFGAAGAHAAEATRAAFGSTPNGVAIEAVTLKAANGISARIINYGATLQALLVPDRDGRSADVVLGYDDLAGYIAKPQFFGSTVGRYANRIAGARFTLDGKTHSLAVNDGPNALHGGKKGFDKVVWKIAEVKSGPVASVTLTYTSRDGEEGYPGTLETSVTYALDDDRTLTIRYAATTDKPTVVNLTNHSLFNLAGVPAARSVLDHRLLVAADAYTPVDATLIPTGEIKSVAGTPFDFRQAALIGARIRNASDPQIAIGRGYDHNFVLKGGVTDAPKLAARVEDPVSGRVLELYTTEPGVQVYTGNFLDGTTVGKAHVVYRQGDGLAVEPQKFPDSPNRAAFPSARLDPGQTYRQTSYFRFSVLGR
ncbi:MAG TPA: aldose epimerase family protein [Gammaproteobacteria bacterium]|nr:aldose epimerase family protein [Gammaproteobacteria bacterium]